LSGIPEDQTGKSEDFLIPDPPELSAEVADQDSLVRAVKEEESNKKGTLEDENRRISMDWNLKFWFKILLFVFVMCLNIT
jgi:hypothetical protein